ncbi:MAG: hypothetical protein H6737_27500 [Alphaproteobacteria bacterium]|nr:hypothetical protein [Alphaproteobacteria bacterium]
MLIGVILFAACTMLVALLLYTRTSPFQRTPLCPNCQIPYLKLVDPPDSPERRSYEVLACPQCTNTTTRVHGSPSRFAYCPSCNQRTLETPARRLPPTLEAPLSVEIDERCHVCGHEHVVILPPPFHTPVVMRGRVIPFPGAKR